MSGNKFQIKRTGVSGRQPNTTNSSNSAYIDVGELALNFVDQILYSSDGNTAIELGANVTNQNIRGTLTANGSVGSNGQVLVSNGSGIYWGESGGTVSSWTVVDDDYTASNGDRLLTDTSANTFTVTLPATPSIGDVVEVADGADWSINSLIVDRNGSTIEGLNSNVVLNINDIAVRFIYGGTPETWQVIAGVGPQGPQGEPGVVISNTEPSNTELLWADTSEEGEPVLPVGGETGQYLIKSSNGDFDTEWSTLDIDLANVSQDIIPSVANTYDLGSVSSPWRDLYLSGNSIFIGNTTITETSWDEVVSGNVVYNNANSGLTSTTLSGAIDEVVGLTDTAYSNAVSYTNIAVANLVNSAPEALDTLNELSIALNNDPDFANTVVGQVTTAYTNAVSYTDSEISALGDMASQNSDSVNITGGSIDNIDNDVTFTSDGAITIPTGNTAQRPANAVNGMIRYNTEIDAIEYYDGGRSDWFTTSDTEIPVQATGGTVTDITQDGVDYRVHTFTSVGTSSFQVTYAPENAQVEYLVVAGGGGGGYGGGGGAGGLINGTEELNPQSYTVVVGDGGDGIPSPRVDGNVSSNNGENSSFLGKTALGGGGTNSGSGNDGGSGGGGRSSSSSKGGSTGLQPTSEDGGFGNGGGQNNPGDTESNEGSGGSGGGAGDAGQQPPTNSSGTSGGIGLDFSNTFGTGVGDNGYFAGGGGSTVAHYRDSGPPDSIAGFGGQGGGGNGQPRSEVDGQPSTGGGGGGGIPDDLPNLRGGNGGSGIVIIRYPI